MKAIPILLAITIFAWAVAYAVCTKPDPADTVQSVTKGKMRQVLYYNYTWVYVVEIDGAEYVLVTDSKGVAITPKVKP